MNEIVEYEIMSLNLIIIFALVIVIVYVIVINNMKSINLINCRMISLFILINYHYNRLKYSLFGSDGLSIEFSNLRIIWMISLFTQ